MRALLRQGKRKSNFVGFFGLLLILGGLVSYQLVVHSTRVLNLESLPNLEPLAYFTMIVVLAGQFFIFRATNGILRDEFMNMKMLRSSPSTVLSMMAHVIGTRPYGIVSRIMASVYGIFYILVSGMMVYQPGLSFSEVYGVKIPSATTLVCCGDFGQVPRFVVYVTEHLGFLVTPANVILLFLVASLVGLNTSLAIFSYRNRPRGTSHRWLGGFGATAGLLTACPSCAGLYFTAILGGLGAASTAYVLAPLWIVFVLISVPTLLVTPYLTSRSLLKTLKGCDKLQISE